MTARKPLELPLWHLSLLGEALGYSFAPDPGRAVDRLAPTVAELSARYTIRRDTVSPALLASRLVREAYFAYYTTCNLLKLNRPLDELAASGHLRRPSLSVLDLGSGTATAYLGLTAWLDGRSARGEATPDIAFRAVDAVRENLAFTIRVHEVLNRLGQAKIASLETMHADLRKEAALEGSYDLILGMNLLNELPARVAEALPERLADLLAEGGALVLVEPALRETSRFLLQLRDRFIREGWTVYAPCFRQAGCPALEQPRDWCHDEAEWNRPEFIRRIDEQVGTLRLSLKSTYLVLNRSGGTLADALPDGGLCLRAVSDSIHEKGRIRLYLCGPVGRHQYLRNTRDASTSQADFADLRRYDIAHVEGAVPRAHDVLVTPETGVRSVALEGAPQSASHEG